MGEGGVSAQHRAWTRSWVMGSHSRYLSRAMAGSGIYASKGPLWQLWGEWGSGTPVGRPLSPSSPDVLVALIRMVAAGTQRSCLPLKGTLLAFHPKHLIIKISSATPSCPGGLESSSSCAGGGPEQNRDHLPKGNGKDKGWVSN